MTQFSGERSGVAGGVMNFGSNLGGMISPALTPWLAERIGWSSALSLTAGLAVMAALLWLGIRVNNPQASDLL
jgi:ACS family glucarate transporter-like MFS transporter